MSKMPPSRERAKRLFAETVEVVTWPETVQVVTAPAPKSQVQPKAQASPSALPVAFDVGTPINTSFGVGRPKRPPALNKDGRRRAGDYVLGAVRIKAETASRPGDFLNGSDNHLALDPGLGPRDFMLSPATQAKTSMFFRAFSSFASFASLRETSFQAMSQSVAKTHLFTGTMFNISVSLPRRTTISYSTPAFISPRTNV